MKKQYIPPVLQELKLKSNNLMVTSQPHSSKEEFDTRYDDDFREDHIFDEDDEAG